MVGACWWTRPRSLRRRCICARATSASAIFPRSLRFSQTDGRREHRGGAGGAAAGQAGSPYADRAADSPAQPGPHPHYAWLRAIGGERRRVEIARSLCIQPNFILLDEPFSGIDPIAVLELPKDYLRPEGQRHRSSDHRPQRARDVELTDRAYIIAEGRISAPEHRASWATTWRCGGFTWGRVSHWADANSFG